MSVLYSSSVRATSRTWSLAPCSKRRPCAVICKDGGSWSRRRVERTKGSSFRSFTHWGRATSWSLTISTKWSTAWSRSWLVLRSRSWWYDVWRTTRMSAWKGFTSRASLSRLGWDSEWLSEEGCRISACHLFQVYGRPTSVWQTAIRLRRQVRQARKEYDDICTSEAESHTTFREFHSLWQER